MRVQFSIHYKHNLKDLKYKSGNKCIEELLLKNFILKFLVQCYQALYKWCIVLQH